MAGPEFNLRSGGVVLTAGFGFDAFKLLPQVSYFLLEVLLSMSELAELSLQGLGFCLGRPLLYGLQ